jgi:hypothetical protein
LIRVNILVFVKIKCSLFAFFGGKVLVFMAVFPDEIARYLYPQEREITRWTPSVRWSPS